jgi:hypothetical protein
MFKNFLGNLFGDNISKSIPITEGQKPNRHATFFWDYFQKKEAVYLNLNKLPPNEAMRELVALAKLAGSFADGLVAELALSTNPSEKSTIIISADGIKSIAEKAKQLAAAAPIMDRWNVRAFRQPTESLGWDLDLKGKKVRPENIGYKVVGREGSVVHLDFFIPELSGIPEKDRLQILFLVLDHTLGEEAVIYNVGKAFSHPYPLVPDKEIKPLPGLPSFINAINLATSS